MPKSAIEKCVDCKFWTTNPGKPGYGFCDRYPPQNVGVLVPGPLNPLTGEPSLNLHTESTRPLVSAQHVCGEFRINLVLAKVN